MSALPMQAEVHDCVRFDFNILHTMSRKQVGSIRQLNA